MKRIFFMMSLFVGLNNQLSAQTPTCDITTGGLELTNSSGNVIPYIFVTGAQGFAQFVITNQGSGANGGGACSYGIGQVEVQLTFPGATFTSYYFKYNGAASFTTAKYTWTYNIGLNALVGTNTVPIPNGFGGGEIVRVPILAVAAGTTLLSLNLQIVNSASGDNTNNNDFSLPIEVKAGSGGVLPVKLESIDGFADKCNAQLKWSTSNEVNLRKFEVEVSKDGISFDRAGTLSASSANAGNYQFNTTQSSGKNYYRLKIIDKDGSVAYSKIIPISTSCSDKVVKIFPNPVKVDQLLNVNISGYDASVKGELYSSTGQLVKTYVLKNGANNLSVENLAQGFYTLRVSENGAVTETFKLNVLQ